MKRKINGCALTWLHSQKREELGYDKEKPDFVFTKKTGIQMLGNLPVDLIGGVNAALMWWRHGRCKAINDDVR